MLELLLLALCAGIIVKAVDWMDDDQKSRHPAKYPLAMLYGSMIGYLIGVAPFSALFLAAVAGQVFAKKFDTTAHRIGLAFTMLIILSTGMPQLDAWVFLFFLVAAFLDEIDYVGNLRWMTEWRPFLKIAAFLFVFMGRFDYFLAIIAFDLGYEAFRVLSARKKDEATGPAPGRKQNPKNRKPAKSPSKKMQNP
jgi:hypothetical protein